MQDALFLAMLMITLIAAYAVTVRDGRIAALEAANDALRVDLANTLVERADALQRVAMKDKQIGGHIRDTEALNNELQRLKCGEGALDAHEIIGDVEAWLEAMAAGDTQ